MLVGAGDQGAIGTRMQNHRSIMSGSQFSITYDTLIF